LEASRAVARSGAAGFVVASLSLCFGNSSEVDEGFLSVARGTKRCPIVRRIRAANAKRNDMIEFDFSKRLVTAKTSKPLPG
jgi:hypothetical protein